ncbi:poly(3-hydroxyalkanoate) depolymerase [Pseudomaricurvus alkylphenolicus]|uniref:poly(3-hydroxyalkanoate) depolymerase n=1 Tax=Pseudomaricurvus alkylphenolicus TaxID=1306991 RepID=UPI0014238ECA|nr:poly(3-hydroxyalkanoate) depolymerase [Pseudomaricurvus alkylphenolicus]NIB39646.1 poly(3-hydroxyalkanoate) depolymerase [Pseudomaricurvus alkylphenolicus]
MNAPADCTIDIEESFVEVMGLQIRIARKAGCSQRPLLLFNGIGANTEILYPLMQELKGIECLTFDMPGIGLSEVSKMPMRFKGLARMSTQILDHFGYGKVDVLGVSWGGGMAQEFAYRYPKRCQNLVLAATSAGAIMVPGKPSVFMKLSNPKRYFDKHYLRDIAQHIYGGELRKDPQLMEEYTDRVRAPKSAQGYLYQLYAASLWTSIHWLSKLPQQTLILAGRDDPLVPIVNARILHSRIPYSQLIEVDCGHLLLMTRMVEISARIVEFLQFADIDSGHDAESGHGVVH